jgi:hypothetical protein
MEACAQAYQASALQGLWRQAHSSGYRLERLAAL